MELLKPTASNSISIKRLPSSYILVPKTSLPALSFNFQSPAILLAHSTLRSSQNRTLWGWSRQSLEPSWQSDDEGHPWRNLKRLEKRSFLRGADVLRRQIWIHKRLFQELHQGIRHHHDRKYRQLRTSWGWGWREFRDNHSKEPEMSSNNPNTKSETRSDDKVWSKYDKIEQMKKEIERDPYNFLFGKSNEWLSYQYRNHQPWTSFVQSFFASNDPEYSTTKRRQSVAGKKTRGEQNHPICKTRALKDEEKSSLMDVSSPTQATRFDPISGRMVSTHTQGSQSVSSESIEVPVKKHSASRIGCNNLAGSSIKHATDNEAVLPSKEVVLQAPLPVEDMETLGPSSMDGNSVLNEVETILVTHRTHHPTPSQQYDVFSTPESETPNGTLLCKDYPIEETKQDDVDLLRAADIRAAFFSKKTTRDQESEKGAHRESLDRQFDTYEDPEGDLNIQDVRRNVYQYHTSAPVTRSDIDSPTGFPNQSKPTETDPNSDLANEIRSIYEDSYGKISSMHQQESQSKTGSKSAIQNQGPTSNETAQILLNSNLDDVLHRIDRVSESIRTAIVEIHDSSSHLEKEKQQESSSTSAIYRVLAYDSSSLRVVSAETGSTFNTPEPPLHPTEVLSRLNNPAKFLPYFGPLQADGYEIVSGGGDILVFKKVRGSGIFTASTVPSEPIQASSMDMTSSLQATKPASIEDLSIPPTDATITSSQAPTSSQANKPQTNFPHGSRMVKRQETVYTGGPPNWSPYSISSANLLTTPPRQSETGFYSSQKDKSSAPSLLRFRENAFFLVVGAATIYAADVVYEYFRTGGEDGRGPEGFTAFEMDRRRCQ